MKLKQHTLADNQFEFSVITLEAVAKKMNVSASETHCRLQKQDLIKQRLFKHYDLLHIQSIQWVTDNLAETLLNWETETLDIISERTIKLLDESVVCAHVT